MNLIDYRESLEKQSSGTPIYVGDAVFFVRRWGTIESQKFLRDVKIALFGPMHKYSSIDDHIVMAEWLAEYAVTGWENLHDEKGEVKFNRSNARKIFLNPEYYSSLNTILYSEASRFENYLHDLAIEDLEVAKKS